MNNLRIEVKVDGVLIEVHELRIENFDLDPISKFWSFIRYFSKNLERWEFDTFFPNGVK